MSAVNAVGQKGERRSQESAAVSRWRLPWSVMSAEVLLSKPVWGLGTNKLTDGRKLPTLQLAESSVRETSELAQVVQVPGGSATHLLAAWEEYVRGCSLLPALFLLN